VTCIGSIVSIPSTRTSQAAALGGNGRAPDTSFSRGHRRALAVIAATPQGITEAMFLDGFSVAVLVDLVAAGLRTLRPTAALSRAKSELLADLAEAGLVRMQKQPVIGNYGADDVAASLPSIIGRPAPAGAEWLHEIKHAAFSWK
jgi:hypothetical protein